jgi:hypothetical protein
MNPVRVVRKLLLGTPLLTATMLLGCAIPQGPGAPPTIPISVSSNNGRAVDVYLLCGDRDAQWLGQVRGKEAELFQIPASRARCVQGLNFFLVSRSRNRGYWVGPLRPRTGSTVHLTIEKYAGLSTADLRGDVR